MPGSIIHLAIAEKIYEVIKTINDSEEYYIKFRIGNLLPDLLEENDKFDSHFWDKEMYRKIARAPIMSLFHQKHKIKSIGALFENPILFGYYCHLVSDVEFINEYWNKNFAYYNERLEEVDTFNDTAFFKVKRTNRVYNRNEFLSLKQYYGDYDIMWSDICFRYNIRPLDEKYRDMLMSIKDYAVDIDKFDKFVYKKENKIIGVEECRVLDIKLIDEYIENTCNKLSDIINKELC